MKAIWKFYGLCPACTLLVCGIFTSETLRADTIYWDTDGAIAGFGNNAGTWGSSSYWSPDSAGSSTALTITTTTNDLVNFGTLTMPLGPVAASVNVSGTVDAGRITFGNLESPVILTGGTINLGGTNPAPHIELNTTNASISSALVLKTNAQINGPGLGVGGNVTTLNLNGPITGGFNVTFLGVNGSNSFGTILLGAQSAYSGSTLLNCSGTGGNITVKLGTNDALPPTTVLTIDGANGSSTATGRHVRLDLNGYNQTLAGLISVVRGGRRNQGIVNSTNANPATLTINNATANTFTGQLGSGGNGAVFAPNFGLTKNGVGKLTLSPANTNGSGAIINLLYTGATTINNGILEIGGAGCLGNGNYAANIFIASGAALVFSGTNNNSLGGTISGSGAITNSGTGTLALQGMNTCTGPIVVNGGTLGGTGVVNGPVTIAAPGTLSPGKEIATLTISNQLKLAGNAVFNLNKTNGQNASSVAGITAVTFGGTLTLTNVGPPLLGGEVFRLFQAGSYLGSFTNIILPSLGQNLAWDLSQLSLNGSIMVKATASYTVNLPSGYSMIVNQVNNGSNTANLFFPNGSGQRDFDCLYFYNCTNDTVLSIYFDSSAPTGFVDSSYKEVEAPVLKPGIGFIYFNQNTSNAVVFNGFPNIPVPVTNLTCDLGSYYYLGRQTNDIGGYVNITGFLPTEGAQVQTLMVTGEFTTNIYTGGVWLLGDPNLAVGQAAKFFIPSGSVVPIEPVITRQPVGQTVLTGGSAKFSINVMGEPPFYYQWQFQGINITNSGRTSGALTGQLSLTNIVTTDFGQYAVIVTNNYGAVTSALATLTMGAKPVIISQPQGISADVRMSADINITADGTAPLVYQWYFNGAIIPGATYTNLALSNIHSNMAGNYTVVVGNAFGSITSQVAVLSIVQQGAAQVFPQPALALLADSNSITLLVSNLASSGALFIQHAKEIGDFPLNSTSISQTDIMANSVVSLLVTNSGQGFFGAAFYPNKSLSDYGDPEEFDSDTNYPAILFMAGIPDMLQSDVEITASFLLADAAGTPLSINGKATYLVINNQDRSLHPDAVVTPESGQMTNGFLYAQIVIHAITPLNGYTLALSINTNLVAGGLVAAKGSKSASSLQEFQARGFNWGPNVAFTSASQFQIELMKRREDFKDGNSESWDSPITTNNPFIVTGGFGEWRGDNNDRCHFGLDLAIPYQSSVFASRSGVVAATNDIPGKGYYVTIDHGDGWFSRYLHLDGAHIKVRPGQGVERGTIIADQLYHRVGWPIHVHFESRFDINKQPYWKPGFPGIGKDPAQLKGRFFLPAAQELPSITKFGITHLNPAQAIILDYPCLVIDGTPGQAFIGLHIKSGSPGRNPGPRAIVFTPEGASPQNISPSDETITKNYIPTTSSGNPNEGYALYDLNPAGNADTADYFHYWFLWDTTTYCNAKTGPRTFAISVTNYCGQGTNYTFEFGPKIVNKPTLVSGKIHQFTLQSYLGNSFNNSPNFADPIFTQPDDYKMQLLDASNQEVDAEFKLISGNGEAINALDPATHLTETYKVHKDVQTFTVEAAQYGKYLIRVSSWVVPDIADEAEFTNAVPKPVILNPTSQLYTNFTANWMAVPGVTNYLLVVSTSYNFDGEPIFSNFVGNVTSTNIGGLTPNNIRNGVNHSYYYRVCAAANNIYSEFSDVATAYNVTLPETSSVWITGETVTGFKANWNPVAGIDGYLLEVATDSRFAESSITYTQLLGTVTNKTITGLNPNRNYYCRVSTRLGSFISYRGNFTYVMLPVFNYGLTTTEVGLNWFKAKWNSFPGASGYIFRVATNMSFTGPALVLDQPVGNATNATATGLVTGKKYYYCVGIQVGNNIYYTSTNNLIPYLYKPSSIFTSDIDRDKFSVNWTPVADAANYQVDVATNTGFTQMVFTGVIPQGTTNCPVTGLNHMTTYCYRVRSINGGIYSTYSATNSTTTYAFPASMDNKNISFINDTSNQSTPGTDWELQLPKVGELITDGSSYDGFTFESWTITSATTGRLMLNYRPIADRWFYFDFYVVGDKLKCHHALTWGSITYYADIQILN